MKKFTKLSLVAAVAVAGLTSANAKPLEEAIKDVEVSGSVVYRYDDSKNENKVLNTKSSTQKNHYKVGLNLASKVNDYVKFNSRFIVGGLDSGFAALDSSSNGDTNVDVTLSNAYFALTAIPNTTVNVGKQGLTTPWTVAVDINGNEQTGTGALALSTVGPVTVAAGYFNQTNLGKSGDHPLKDATNAGSAIDYITGGGVVTNTGSRDIATAAIIGDLEVVQLEAWYLTMQDYFKTYTLAATSNIELAENAKLGLEARYVNLKLDNELSNALGIINNSDKKNSLMKFAVNGKFDIVNARIAYTKTGKHGGLTALDNDAKNTSLGWKITSNDVEDANYWQFALGADILENLNFTLNYGTLETDFNNASPVKYEEEELYGQLTYKMSKNLTTYVRYGTFESKLGSIKIDDNTNGRLQVAYTF
ncbi:major outer membrane protein [Aliarcobacter skirrowii]|uniref:major outer membrane protein n=1 Tax=Aliarcobacter skirrowii TaxID=28200 RepID=UPI0029A2A3B8|nr:major outer membrane protein [Aliarcobacter skirrowii]MDX4048245.1 major outer membrane protein [Aliarcobacter skirrowii]